MGCTNSGGKNTVSDIKAQIDRLKAENVQLLQRDYTGGKKWGGQLDAAVKKAANNNKKIEQLESQIKKQDKSSDKTKPKAEKKTSGSTWKRAGEGWYIGEKGHEIRENYDKGGFDIVKVSGGSEKYIKHFDKLKDAKKYRV